MGFEVPKLDQFTDTSILNEFTAFRWCVFCSTKNTFLYKPAAAYIHLLFSKCTDQMLLLSLMVVLVTMKNQLHSLEMNM